MKDSSGSSALLKTSESDPSANSETQIERLLVVDDEESNRDLMSRRFRRAGYSVATAADGQQALQWTQNNRVDLVLLDIMMPRTSGLALLKTLRATYTSSQLPIIMVSAIHESDQIVEALGQGANDYITKPIDFSVAVARIRTQLLRKKADEALRESEERYALAALGTKDGLWDWNREADQINYSTRWKELLGYEEKEIGTAPQEWLSRIHPEDRARVDAEFTQHLAKGDKAEFVSEHRIQHKNGSYRWMLCRGVTVQPASGSPGRMVGSLSDITTSKAFDSLTGLPNRVLFVEKVAALLQQTSKPEAKTFAVLFIDLDGFKVINDSLGHDVGDQLLKAMARRLQDAVRSDRKGCHDEVARFGGDEFAVLVTNLANSDEGVLVAERILERLRALFKLEDREVFIGASIGIAMADPQYETPTEILRDADTAMYRAKSSGRSQCRLFDAAMRANAVERLELQNDLPKAIENKELALYYQPKVRLDTGKLFGFEALLRWKHPDYGFISPLRFIPIAEETGLIISVGAWVLEETCRQLRTWQDNFPSDPPLQISLNVSVKQLDHPGFVDCVRKALQETGVPPHSLQLELTESVLLAEGEATTKILYELKDLGVGLSVDDFGTGYSSLNRLDRYPFDNIKIDQSFINRLGQDERSAKVIRSIVMLAQNLKIDVIAEGVERLEQAEQLLHLGCQSGQGYLFAKPLPVEEAESLLPRRSLLAVKPKP